MDTLICKVCGYTARSSREKNCYECGAPLYPVEQAPAAEGAPGAEEEVYINREKPVGKKATAARRAAWLLLVCLAVQALGLWSLSWRRGGEDWSAVWMGRLVTPQGVWSPEGWFISPALDNSHPHKVLRAVKDDVLFSGTLAQGEEFVWYYYDAQTLKPTDWQAGTVSGDGRVLFYLRREGEETVLYRQELDRGPARAVDRARISGPAVNVLSAWDGSAAAWAVADGVGMGRTWVTLRQWDRLRGGQALDEERDIGISALGRNGDSAFIHWVTPVGVNEYEWSIVLRWGEEELEMDSSGGGSLTEPILDRDLTQVLYQQDGRYWYVEVGKEPVAVTGLPEDIQLSALFPPGDEFYGYGYYSAVCRLTDWVYRGSDSHLYYLGADLRATDLTPDWRVRDWLIDKEGTTLYCSSSTGGLYRMDRPGPERGFVQLEERGGWELSGAPDLSLVGYVTWEEGKQVQQFLDTRSGERIRLKSGGTTCLLKGGGRWRVDERNGVWFWRGGEDEERPVTLEEDGESKEKKLEVSGAMLMRVGDGSQALLHLGGTGLLRYGGSEPSQWEETFWLLDCRGTARKLAELPVPVEK